MAHQGNRCEIALPGLDAIPTWIAVGAGAVWLTDAAPGSPTGSTVTSAVPHSRLFRIDPRTMRPVTAPVPLAYSPTTPLIAFGSLWLAPGFGEGGLFRIRLR